MSESLVPEDRAVAVPLPVLSEPSHVFWTSGADGRMRITRCLGCGYYLHPPAPICRKCHSFAQEWHPVSGRGLVESFSRLPPGHVRLYAPDTDVVAIVVLAEQGDLRLTTNIIGCLSSDVAIGLSVRLSFVECGQVFLPMFTAIGS
jgi:uncharacterized protein